MSLDMKEPRVSFERYQEIAVQVRAMEKDVRVLLYSYSTKKKQVRTWRMLQQLSQLKSDFEDEMFNDWYEIMGKSQNLTNVFYGQHPEEEEAS